MATAAPLQIAGDCGRPEASRRRHQLRLELLAPLVDGAVPGGLTADAIVLDLATRPSLAGLDSGISIPPLPSPTTDSCSG